MPFIQTILPIMLKKNCGSVTDKPSVHVFNRHMCNNATPRLTNPLYLSSTDTKCNIATPVLANPSQVQHLLSTCLTGNSVSRQDWQCCQSHCSGVIRHMGLATLPALSKTNAVGIQACSILNNFRQYCQSISQATLPVYKAGNIASPGPQLCEIIWRVILDDYKRESKHPGLAEIFAPNGVPGSDIMENFRQQDNSWVQDGSKTRCKTGFHNMFTKISK